MRATRPCAGHQLGSMSIATRIGAGAAPGGGLDQVEVRRLVDDERRVGVGTLGREQRQLGKRLAIGRRVADEDVLVTLAGEVERLGQGEHRIPRKLSSRPRIRSSTFVERTDLEAMRTGRGDACAASMSAFERMASRSTNANGGEMPSKIAS